MEDIRIATNTWNVPPQITGGLDVHVWELSKALSSFGAKIDVYYPGDREKEVNFNLIPMEKERSLDYYGVSKINKEIFQILNKKRSIDLFHSQDWLGVEAGYRSKKYLEVPWIFSCHSLEWMRTGRGEENPKICEMERLGIEKSDAVITVSEWMKEKILEDYDVAEDKIRVVPNGYRDLEEGDISPREEHGIGEDLFVLYLGRLSEQKGIRYLLYAAAKILKDHNNVKFVIGGKGPLKGSLKKFTNLLGIQENVLFVGFIPEQDIGSYYSEADVFISPSLSEPFGMTVLEAWNKQTKVISTPCGAHEFIDNESDLIKVRRRNSEDIYKSLSSLIKNRGDLKAGNPKEKEDTWKKAAEETLKVYRDVLA